MILFWPKRVATTINVPKQILFWHQKTETIVMKCYCFGTFCVETCPNDTISAKNGCNKYKCAKTILF